MDIPSLHQLFLQHPEVSTDSRNIPENGIFFALKGTNFDGNRFAREALEKGASFAVVDDPEIALDAQFILVDDTLKTLQELATYHRTYCKTPSLALTGSNGKTTTKELFAAVLQKRFKTLATRGNLNNQIGVPLTLLQLQPDMEMAVIEMGANHQGEIGFLCNLAQPDFGYITNFGKAHLEGFGGVEGVIKGKSEMFNFLITNAKTIFWNADDPIQQAKLERYANTHGFSQQPGKADQTIQFLDADPYVRLQIGDVQINTQLIGAYNFTNCAAAVLVGMYFGIAVEDIRMALEAYIPNNNRSQLIQRGSGQIILDAYNANPSSMTAALHHFQKLESVAKVAILGDMFELGADAELEHLSIGKLAQSLGLSRLYLVGKNFAGTQLDEAKYPDLDSLKTELSLNPIPKGATVLIKGSRGMALERILDFI
jgi:UDP-N-acetylmuramoyl-tripeptide--D-alanyl-D-alanine ligase